ncbi:hypothetical protein [Mycobacterium sp.]|uniref:hypothetical protein n=1 Tax=Mycobacterium sp. TaxID=1785 RepID=UPI0031D9781D
MTGNYVENPDNEDITEWTVEKLNSGKYKFKCLNTDEIQVLDESEVVVLNENKL